MVINSFSNLVCITVAEYAVVPPVLPGYLISTLLKQYLAIITELVYRSRKIAVQVWGRKFTGTSIIYKEVICQWVTK